MYKIEKVSHGFTLTFGGAMTADEMKGWKADSEKALKGQSGAFGVFVDMRTLKPLPPDAQPVMVAGQQLYKEKGMQRSVVILNDAVTTMQFRRLAKESGIYAWERYLDASSSADWKKVGEAWLTQGVDPDA